MDNQLNEVVVDLTERAEYLLKHTKSPQELIGKVMQQGTRAVMSKNFTLEQAEECTAMLLAAIALAKNKGA